MNVQNIASRVQIVALNQHIWNPNPVNRAETRKVNGEHGTGEKAVVRVRICDHPILEKLEKLKRRLYADHKSITRPSVQDGTRLLPVSKALEHAELVRTARVEHDAMVADFLTDYDTARALAPTALNGLYQSRDWPDVATVRSRFGIECRYLPCPTDGAWGEWLTESATAATAELRD